GKSRFKVRNDLLVVAIQSGNDGVPAPSKMDVVNEGIAELRAKPSHDAARGLGPVRSHVGEEGVAPKSAAVGSRVIPGIARVAEGNPVFFRDVVIAADVDFAPVLFVRFAGRPVIAVGV